MVDLKEILIRFKACGGLKTDKQVADLFGITPQNLWKKKEAGTLLRLIIDDAINRKVDLNRLLTGGPFVEDSSVDLHDRLSSPIINEHLSEYGRKYQHIDLIRMACEVLDSSGIYSTALAAAIKSLYQAINTDRQLKGAKQSVCMVDDRVRKGDPPEKKEELIRQRAISSG